MAEVYKTVANIPSAVTCVGIPDQLCARTGLNLAWAGERKFGVHAFDAVHSSGHDRKSRHAPCKDLVYEIRDDSILYHAFARKLVAESCDYFLYAQKVAKNPRSAELVQEISSISKGYRCILRGCLVDFQEAAESANESEQDLYLSFIPKLYNMELVWHLCHILFVEPLPGHLVLAPLIGWLRFHTPHVEKEALKLLEVDEEGIEKEENYWPVVIDCLLQQRIETVRALLRLHSRSKIEAFQLMDKLLRTMPMFMTQPGISATEFKVLHECWRKEAARLQRTGHFSSINHLDTMAKIIIGDDSADEEIRRHSETWYQHMVASLIYTSPAVKVFDLAFHANRSLALYSHPERTSTNDWILCAAFEMDVYKMVERGENWPDCEWMLTHLIHLLDIIGKIPASGPTDISERLLLSYGCKLMGHPTLWQFGIDYLENCPNEGRECLDALLARIPFKTNNQALKLIQIAGERGFGDTVYTISKVQGKRFESRGELGGALSWAMRSQDPVFCTQLADQFIKDYMKTGRFQCLDLLENLGCDISLGDRLIFLGKYCEFLKMKERKELKEAGSLLVTLFTNKVAPKFFWMRMFEDAMSFLGDGSSHLSTPEVMDLMMYLNDLVNDKEIDLPKKKIEEMRVALVNELAKGFIFEGTVSLNN